MENFKSFISDSVEIEKKKQIKIIIICIAWLLILYFVLLSIFYQPTFQACSYKGTHGEWGSLGCMMLIGVELFFAIMSFIIIELMITFISKIKDKLPSSKKYINISLILTILISIWEIYLGLKYLPF